MFGGLRAVDGVSLQVARRRAARADRAERCRQDHAVPLHHRHAAADRPAACSCSATTSRDLPEHRRTALGMGRTFQITNVFTDLTLRENLVLAIVGTDRRKWIMNRPVDAFPAVRDAGARGTWRRWAWAIAPMNR